jgi:hypothetical protein
MRTVHISLAILILSIAISGCGSNQTLQVNTLQLGRSLNADNSVGNFTTTFAPTDTIYLAVLTSGAGDGTLAVRWSFGGRVISEPTKKISYKDSAATEFHLQSGDGFPPGEYKAEVSLDGKPVGTREFKVESR